MNIPTFGLVTLWRLIKWCTRTIIRAVSAAIVLLAFILKDRVINTITESQAFQTTSQTMRGIWDGAWESNTLSEAIGGVTSKLYNLWPHTYIASAKEGFYNFLQYSHISSAKDKVCDVIPNKMAGVTSFMCDTPEKATTIYGSTMEAIYAWIGGSVNGALQGIRNMGLITDSMSPHSQCISSYQTQCNAKMDMQTGQFVMWGVGCIALYATFCYTADKLLNKYDKKDKRNTHTQNDEQESGLLDTVISILPLFSNTTKGNTSHMNNNLPNPFRR